MTTYRKSLLQSHPSPAISSFSFSVPLTLAQIQLERLRTPAMWQCHRFHALLRDDYLTAISSCNTLSCIEVLQLSCCSCNNWYWPQCQCFHQEGFFGIDKTRKMLITTNRKCWIRGKQNARYLIRDGVSKKGVPGHTIKTPVAASFASCHNCRQCSSGSLMDNVSHGPSSCFSAGSYELWGQLMSYRTWVINLVVCCGRWEKAYVLKGRQWYLMKMPFTPCLTSICVGGLSARHLPENPMGLYPGRAAALHPVFWPNSCVYWGLFTGFMKFQSALLVLFLLILLFLFFTGGVNQKQKPHEGCALYQFCWKVLFTLKSLQPTSAHTERRAPWPCPDCSSGRKCWFIIPSYISEM